jgi:hypothetical protein
MIEAAFNAPFRQFYFFLFSPWIMPVDGVYNDIRNKKQDISAANISRAAFI